MIRLFAHWLCMSLEIPTLLGWYMLFHLRRGLLQTAPLKRLHLVVDLSGLLHFARFLLEIKSEKSRKRSHKSKERTTTNNKALASSLKACSYRYTNRAPPQPRKTLELCKAVTRINMHSRVRIPGSTERAVPVGWHISSPVQL